MKRYSAVLFDLDGTLLDTLEDLTNAVNFALRESGYPERTLNEVRSFVGNGVGMLVRRALPAGAECDEEACAEVLQAFKSRYAAHNGDLTVPYPGIMDMLEALARAGVKTAIVSNKNDPNVQALTGAFFGGRIDLAVGEREGVRPKPCPDAPLQVLKQFGLRPEEALYVGDSDVDAETASNAGMPFAAVTWGFQSRERLVKAGAKTLVDTPQALLNVILGKGA